MQLFNNFDNVPDDYIPNNMFPPTKPVKNLEIPEGNVVVVKDWCHKIVGYRWNYGEDVSIKFSNTLKVHFPENSIVIEEAGVEPDESTHTETSVEGQKFYNVTDIISWTLKQIIPANSPINPTGEDRFIWEKDSTFKYVDKGPIEYTLVFDMSGKTNLMELSNFRREVILTQVADQEETDFLFHLTSDESRKVLPGIYYLDIYTIEPEKESLTNSYQIEVINGFTGRTFGTDSAGDGLLGMGNPLGVCAPQQ